MANYNPKSASIPPVNRRGEVDMIEPDFDIIWQDMAISGYIDMIADELVDDVLIDMLVDDVLIEESEGKK